MLNRGTGQRSLGQQEQQRFGPTTLVVAEDYYRMRSVWCGILICILAWLIIITIVFSIVLSGQQSDLNRASTRYDDDIAQLFTEASANAECCDHVNETVTGFESCVDDLCDPSFYPRILDATIFKGCWDANSNTPTLASGIGTNGNMYIVCVAGNTTLDSQTNWMDGNVLIFVGDSGAWVRVVGGA